MFFNAALTILVSSLGVNAQFGYGAPPPPGTTTTPSVAVPSAPPGDATHVNVDVSPNGAFMFSPNQITAANGTTVTFWFPNQAITHSVTQSSFDAPCSYLAATSNSSAGFDSGLTTSKQFSITITDDTKPIWFHCKQFQHCGMGMVGSINAPQNGTNTFAAFQAAASKIGLSEPQETDTGAVTGGLNAIATNPPAATGSGAVGSSPPPGNTGDGLKVVASLGAILLAGFATGATFLLPDAQKLGFRSSPSGIAKLSAVRNIPEADHYWDQYTILFDSASDVFSLITPQDIRRALLEAPENVATLIRVVTSRLFTLISDHTFPSAANASVAAFASSFIQAGTGASERSTTGQVLNCLRILQRVLPVVFEVEGEGSAFELEVLWKKEEVVEDPVEASSEAPQFVIEDEDDSDGEIKESTPPVNKQKKQLPSRGERLFSSIIDLLFCCGFTLPTKIQVDHHKINYVIWEKGIGSTSDPGPSHAYDNNKIEVLRLLLVLLSRQIYVSSASLFSKPSLYTLHVVQKTPRRDILTVLCSLLNTAMNSSQAIPTNLAGMAGKVLPYNHLVFKGEDPRSNLVAICLQVLSVLLDFQSGSARDKSNINDEANPSAPTARTNAFRYFLMKLHRTQDFAFILDGIVGILEQQMASMNILLPGARKSVQYINETVIFFWKMIELNKKFRAYLLESDKSMDVVAYLLCYTLEIKDKPQQHGLCRAVSYIVQTLSAEPSFGARLTKPVKAQLPSKWNAPGTAADFFINAVYAIVATTSGQLNSLYPALIIALSNSAPYFANLTVTASARLIQLFTSFSNPLFLLADEGHPRLLFFMQVSVQYLVEFLTSILRLEIFNAVILYNLSANPNLIYGILSAHKAFEDLRTFTLSRGLREIRRVQLAKEEQARKDVKGKGPQVESEDASPHEEKAKLLRHESEYTHGSNDSTEASPRHSQDPETSMVLPTSPMSENVQGSTSSSEKVRGKMRARRSHSLERNGSLDRIAASGIGRNGFVPTQEWVTSWQQGLPLDCVMLLISELLPKVQEMQANRHRTTSTSAIVEFLGTVNLQHVLPPAPPLNPRRFMWSDSSIVWLTSLIWGEVYVRAMTPLGIWNATNVRLFYVKHAPTQQRQLTEAVSNVVGGLWGRTNSDAARARPAHSPSSIGYPGVPPGPERPQAAVKGAIEVRVGPQGAKAKWVRIELRKVETLPGGGVVNTFHDFVGPSPVNLWSASEEYGLLRSQDFPFSIRIPESIPPSIDLQNRAGINYELVASVCTKGKKGFLRKRKSVVVSTQADVLIDKHELHSTWPVYCQPETRNINQEGVTLIVERSATCYGPGDRVSLFATVKSDALHTVILRGFELTLKESTIFRAGPYTSGKKSAPQVRVISISENKFPVNATLYGGTQHRAELTCMISPDHTTTTLNAARHIDITYTLSVKALMGTGTPLIMDLPVILSNWQRAVSAEAIRRIGPAPSLSLLPNNPNTPTRRPEEPQPQTFAGREPPVNRSVVANAYNTMPASQTPTRGTDEFGGYTNSKPTHKVSNSRSSADEGGSTTRPGTGRRPGSADRNRFTITNAPAGMTAEDPAPQQALASAAAQNTAGRVWPTAEDEKARLYEDARRNVEKTQGQVGRGASPPPIRASTPPRAATTASRWPTAEEEKLRLFNEAQEAVKKTQGSEFYSGPSRSGSYQASAHGRSNSDLANDSTYKPVAGGSARPSNSSGQQKSSNTPKIPQYMTADQEKAALKRYHEAKQAVGRVQGHVSDEPDPKYASGSSPVAYDSLFPSSSGSSGNVPNGKAESPPPFDAGSQNIMSHLSEKERLRRAYAAQDAAATQQNTRSVDDAPPPFSGSRQVSAFEEKQMLQRKFEAQDAESRRAAGVPQPPPRKASNSSLSRPTPTSPGPVKILTALEEKALLKARYENEDAPSKPKVNGNSIHTNGGGFSSPSSSVSTPSTPPAPPPLKPRPPVEYIQETQEEDLRVSQFVTSGVVSAEEVLPSTLSPSPSVRKSSAPGLDVAPFTPFSPGFDPKLPGPPPPLPPKPAE
ncbi:high-temperature-induced dauer-formation protein-domain-containing protein [Favolaschia claudopus]|uniref:High-temperature-induced dauer-formation protein-domain-containing protein n=1 Tax=Favolaschia claudopus TaxID=2862362 RepID=A0AAW0BCL4_9AGAR